jgi:hypothetical protein
MMSDEILIAELRKTVAEQAEQIAHLVEALKKQAR